MKTPEQKVAEQIATLSENHWFNAATMGRYLSDQPIYTLDRIMELVAMIIHYQDLRHTTEGTAGRTSEGLFLANELNKTIKETKTKYKFNNLALPK